MLTLAIVSLAGGSWSIWKDRMSRDGDGYVSIGSTELSADVYAIAGDLRGDGPGWLYGSAIIGDERVRAEVLDGSAVLHRHRPRGGCRPLPDGSRACHDRGLRGVLEHSPESPPSRTPSGDAIWAASTARHRRADAAVDPAMGTGVYCS